jgi:hypothetical protein
LVSYRIQQFPNIPPTNVLGVPVEDWGERPPQAALDLLCGSQTARNPSSDVEFDQFFDPEPRSFGSSALLFLDDQVATGPRRAGQLIGTLARLFKAQIAHAPERYASHLP